MKGNRGLEISVNNLKITQIFDFQSRKTNWAFMVSKRHHALVLGDTEKGYTTLNDYVNVIEDKNSAIFYQRT